MKKAMNLGLVLCLFLCVWGCKKKPITHEKFLFDKVVIYYQPDIAPWGLLKVVSVPAKDFLRDSDDELCKIVITNKDSLRFISQCIIDARLDTLKNNDYVDTSIAMLLYSRDRIDTLASDAYPQYSIQYNNTIFQDSLLVYYMINAIEKRDSIWKKGAKAYYYNGQYQHLPKSIWSKPSR